MPCLEKLRVRGFNPGFLKTLWDSERPGPRNIRELYLEKLKWNKFMWGEFMAALANPRHPLARSVHTLHLMLGGSENLNSLAAMLHQNSYLSNVSITVPRAASSAPKIIASCQATNGLQLQQRLSPRHKMAFLSVITKSAIPWESHVMSMIFSFAAPTATRFVRLYLANSSEAGERDEALERLIAHYYPGLRLG